MNTNAWIKQTNFRLFGVKIFEKEEVCTEQNYDGEIIQVNISQDYFDKEFKTDKNDDNC